MEPSKILSVVCYLEQCLLRVQVFPIHLQYLAYFTDQGLILQQSFEQHLNLGFYLRVLHLCGVYFKAIHNFIVSSVPVKLAKLPHQGDASFFIHFKQFFQ